jgi:Periplasmic copper-binding protein (NosD)
MGKSDFERPPALDRSREETEMKRKRSAPIFFAAVMMIGWAGSAGAVDGVIQINQVAVTSDDGFPYTISTPNTSYRLTGSLTVPASTDGIDVTAPNVTIDLNGFSITGAGGTSAIGINATGEGDVTVENGTVTGFTSGSGIDVGNNGIVKNMHADSNGTGIIVGGTYAVVQACTTNSNGTAGILLNAAGSVISGNTVNGNGNGINANLAASALIIGNTITNNTSDGILGGSSSVGYRENLLLGNTSANIGGTATSMGNNLCNGTAC